MKTKNTSGSNFNTGRKALVLTITAFSLSIINNCFTQNIWKESSKILPIPYLANQYDYYGDAVDIDGNHIIVGAPGYDSDKGQVYIIENDGVYDTVGVLTASDIDIGGRFGSSVSISDEVIVVGAYLSDENGNNSGVAYVFVKPVSGWKSMTETAKLTASDGASDNEFGHSVCISGDVIIIGASHRGDNGSNSGSAYVFEKPVGGWSSMTETAKLTASDGDSYDYFGHSVSISDSIIVVGAYQDDDNGSNSGSAYLFKQPVSGWSSMTETAKLTASDGVANDEFGVFVSICDSIIVIGAHRDGDNGTNSGSAYLFKQPVSGWISMTETAKLKASDGVSYDNFGYSVSIKDSVVVIGAYQDDDKGSGSGSAYVFKQPVSGWTNMTETAKLTASDGTANDNFGKSVSIGDSTIVVGANLDEDDGKYSGSAYIFEKPGLGWNTSTETKKIHPIKYLTNRADQFGSSLDIDSNLIAIGGKSDTANIVIIYEFDKGMIDTVAILSASDDTSNNYFGSSVSISNNTVVIGAYGDDEKGYRSGAAYVFEKPVTGWTNMTETAKLTASDATASDEFGCSVSISGNDIVVGAYKDDDGSTNSGSAYVFEKPVTGWTNMTETAKLNMSFSQGDNKFGFSVGISNEVIVVGAYGRDDLGDESRGMAFVFEKPVTGWTNMTETATLRVVQGDPYDYFGYSVDISLDVIVVGAYGDDEYASRSGTAYVYEKPLSGWVNMNESVQLIPSAGNADDFFGRSVGICNDIIVIGTYNDDTNGDNSGAAYIFEKPHSGWASFMKKTETIKITPSDGNAEDNFGLSVCASGYNTIIGSPGNGYNSSGAVYIFTRCASESTINPTACTEYTSPSGKYTWASSGIYYDTLYNAAGCDSIVTVNLTILNSTSNTINISACESYTSPSGKYIWTNSDSYIDTIPNNAGCDSVITINLIINNSSSATINPTACDSYISPSGKIWTLTETYKDTIPNSAGCDSIITINLTIDTVNSLVNQSSDISLTAAASEAIYQWLDCENNYAAISGETNQVFTATASGSYSVEITQNNCVDTSICYSITVSNIVENSFGPLFKLYPNPIVGEFTIHLGQTYNDVSITVRSITGQIISNHNFGTTDILSYKIKVTKGLYLVEINVNEGKKAIIKVLKP